MLCVHTSFYKISLQRKVDEKRSSGTMRPLHIQFRLCKLLSSLSVCQVYWSINLCTTKLTLLGVQSSEFWQMYTVMEPSPQKFPYFFCSQFFPSPPGLGNHLPDFCPYSFAFLECHMDGTIQYVAFCVWLLSCSRMLLKFIPALVSVVCAFSLLCCSPLYGCTMICLLVHQSMDFGLFPDFHSFE